MKAPGRVTRPTVRVWSSPGKSASRADGWMTRKAASADRNPNARAASYVGHSPDGRGHLVPAHPQPADVGDRGGDHDQQLASVERRPPPRLSGNRSR
jgi:hypothetical protein